MKSAQSPGRLGGENGKQEKSKIASDICARACFAFFVFLDARYCSNYTFPEATESDQTEIYSSFSQSNSLNTSGKWDDEVKVFIVR